eukprot:c24107_g1_i1 orf=358-3687(+)
MKKNGKLYERGGEKTGKQVFKSVEASGHGSTDDISGPVKDSRYALKEKNPGITEFDQVDLEEEIVWDGRGHTGLQCPSTSLQRNSPACKEAGNAAALSSQRRGEAKWVPLPAQNQTGPHQYAALRSLLGSKLTEMVGNQSGNDPKFRAAKPHKRNGAQKKGSRVSVEREFMQLNGLNDKNRITGRIKAHSSESQVYSYVEKSLLRNGKLNSFKEAAFATESSHSDNLQQNKPVASDNLQQNKPSASAAGEFRGRAMKRKDSLLFWIARKGIDEGEITVSQPFSSQDRLHGVDVGQTKVSLISVSNNGKRVVNLVCVKLLYTKPKASFRLTLNSDTRPSSIEVPTKVSKFSSPSLLGSYSLLPGCSLSFQLACTARAMGYHKAVLLFDLGRQKILRYAHLMAEDDIAKALAPSEPYSRPTAKVFQTRGGLVRGPPPRAPHFAKPLGAYQIPRDIERSLIKDRMLPVFLHGLSFETYQEYFSSLIYAEELQWKAEIHTYDLQNVTMWLDKSGYLALRVPGLLERRPSVIYGDAILVRSLQSEKKYQGFVYRVQAEEVLLKFHASFHKNFIANQQYDVRFSYSRITIRRCLQAIDASKNLENNFLFPSFIPPAINDHVNRFTPVNRVLNEEQKQSVVEILKKGGGPPYLVYGPPGTGKTVTVVEAVMQILNFKPDGKILACAPSNAAADILLDRLRGCIQVMDLLRLNAFTRPLDDVAPELWPYCCSEGSFFCCPSLEKLLKYKVIVSTYCSVAVLEAQGLEEGHFSHIFLDECGQGMEPEALVALANFVSLDTVVVLAGDHQQLGPIIRSPVAQKFGLGLSLLERLLTLPLYSRSPGSSDALEFNRAAVTKLVRNYRSHPTILDLPSRLFYNGELIACAPQEICNSLCGWEELPNKNFPVLFVGVEGKDEREGKSPSWFNAQEASKVVEMVAKLKEYRRSRLSDNDIGIISPYNQQVKKIKLALALKGMKGIKTGSVEQFQGQERKVIIISTVRSSQDFVESDKLHQIGFLENPKRFNVAITRAQALLVIIGNPYVLSQDPQWGELLQYCLSHNSYVGCTPPMEHTAEAKELNEYLDELLAVQEPARQDGDLPFADHSAADFESPWPDPTC